MPTKKTARPNGGATTATLPSITSSRKASPTTRTSPPLVTPGKKAAWRWKTPAQTGGLTTTAASARAPTAASAKAAAPNKTTQPASASTTRPTSGAEASAEDLLATRLSLIGDITNQYLQIAYTNDQLALNAAYQKNAAETLRLTQAKVDAGSASRLDLRQAEQNRTNLENTRNTLENQRQQAETTLASLSGQPLTRVITQEPSLSRLSVPPINTAIPAHLLAQRPDLRAAQYRLQQNIGNIQIAERDYYPDLSLGANLSTGADRILQILQNPVAALSANITLPFLNYHKKDIARREAETGYQQSLASFRQTLYRALGETQNAILNLAQSQQEAQNLQERLAQAKDIEALTRIRYQAGAASLQDVLEKEDATRSVEETLLANRYQQLTRSVTLHLALGGSLQDNAAARPQPEAHTP